MNVQEYNIAVRQWAPHLLRFAYRGCNNMDLAKDIVQEAFESLWTKRENVNALKVKQYLFSTAYRKSIDLYRKSKDIVEFDSSSIELAETFNYEKTYSDKEILNMAMKNLSEIHRQLILLRDMEGYDYTEIETITGLGQSQVKVYLFRARKSLKEQIIKLDVQWKK